jgi:gamma-glutamyltranspeptidase / glutathione hydrolase
VQRKKGPITARSDHGYPPRLPAVAFGGPGSSAVATGNRATTDAAVAVLGEGGNAVDAALAAGFASTVAEPGLTSMAGGGFLLVQQPNVEPALLDFFAAVPGIDRLGERVTPTKITVVYPSAQQDFRVGPAAAAVPGNLTGFLTAHSRFGRVPLERVVAPSIALAATGAEIDVSQAYILELIEAIVRHSDSAEQRYAPEGQLLAAGDTFVDAELAVFLEAIANGVVDSLLSPLFADRLLAMAADGCAITEGDLRSYRAVWREPEDVVHRDWRLLTNPVPAFGGRILARAFEALNSAEPLAITDALARATQEIKQGPAATAGTTHISVVDAEGMIATMTTTNGAGGGVVIPGIGVHVNNMLGEDDLLPRGVGDVVPGERLRSMIAPSVLIAPNGTVTALGSGGSARIRTALTTVIAHLSFTGDDLATAVAAPRAHLADDGTVQAEIGFAQDQLTRLRRQYRVNEWDTQDFYFGGVNAVQRWPDGSVAAVADHRRNGSVAVLSTA